MAASCSVLCVFLFFFFNDTATTEIYTLSLHDALPIYDRPVPGASDHPPGDKSCDRSEEHTSELQSRVDISYAVFCLKKKNNRTEDIRTPAHTEADTATRSHHTH